MAENLLAGNRTPPVDAARPVGEAGGRTGTLIHALAFLTAAWMLAFYLLPHTVWSRTSPLNPLADRLESMLQPASVWGGGLLLGAGLSVWYLYRVLVRRESSGRRPLWILIGVYVALLAVQIATAHKETEAALAACRVLLPLVGGLLAARLCSTGASAIRLLCLLGSVQALYTLLYVKTGIRLTEREGAGGTFGDPDAVYFLMLVSLPLAVSEAICATKASALACWSAGTALLIAALVATGNHLGIATAILSVGWLTSHFVKRGRIALLGGLVLAAIAVVTVHRQTPGASVFSARSVPVRVAVWKASLPHLTSHFWNGSGVGSFDAPSVLSDSQAVPGPAYQPLREPGNTLLHFMEELGIAGGLLIVLFAAALLHIVRFPKAQAPSALRYAWAGVLVACLFDTPFGSAGRACGTAVIGLLLGMTLLPMDAPLLLDLVAEEPAVPTSEAARGRWLRVPAIATAGVMSLLAVCFALMTVRALTRRTTAPQEARALLLTMPARQLLLGRTDFLGDPNSPFTLIEFGDYECPPCRAQRAAVHAMLARYPGKLKLDFRNLPLPTLHPHAMHAAIVAEASRMKGGFWRVHASLFDLNLDDQTIPALISERFGATELPSVLLAKARRAVETDMDLAGSLQIEGTPSFLLCRPDGKVYRLQAPEDLERLL